MEKITINAFFLLLNIGQIILPFRQSTLAHHVVTFKQEQKSSPERIKLLESIDFNWTVR